MSSIVAFLKDESGATAIEYGLMAAGISVVILATLNTVGSKLNAKFDEISGLLKVRKNSRADLPEAAVRAAAFFRPLRKMSADDPKQTLSTSIAGLNTAYVLSHNCIVLGRRAMAACAEGNSSELLLFQPSHCALG